MSRIGKKLIELPTGVKVEIGSDTIKVSGPKGELSREIHPDINVELKDNKIFVTPKRESKKARALWGLYRALIFNMVEGVSKGYEIKLEIEGVGFKAIVEPDALSLNVGFIHPVKIKKPEGVTFAVEKNVIIISGIDKQKVGQISAEIRQAKKAEPYKGKGIKYQGEKIRRKEGKKVVAAKK
ncbi:MAG: 50S ribosomal protein L6 [Candidatus Staskawiczbacteria bacterium RIFOXYB2_FULL_32_9]|uniref:Large ribosomal subunit protein uL6 n=1 Tax=Candidatus Staskawiczbacteria bacterium RIFOXYD1_FULL_32_13 TaxID=1802234 RepID=A0A1G2JMY3_9BACT|nr:MAG: 50S ribosomal protein L6 [Parcubacteria group bacterium GW2011_GWC2_32_10]OGZ79025.1 MAG: 50S ribosomal protein L6 [Candidatus Staskawiczbacteria bacterium RIFOXYB1_FULL_32_11]OGZ79709.1 MAG: 50S ribosomal protein L6 [Candidatus Staskawiczbacteria bacterium RIFOXYA2_FULL_32_7]OGZ82981.1 MAG: 50S ribosomal protein L6 [Candidatus Staskawiczbacteria bacterium RIFOXYB2_FULL_32_9]OGZ87811.1 MAG: 50S ribosomal protein L6 [Candidatus Staskawiczbacteria bacterium RIFOXYD1_FULL_32_13]OGZ88283.1